MSERVAFTIHLDAVEESLLVTLAARAGRSVEEELAVLVRQVLDEVTRHAAPEAEAQRGRGSDLM